jgi:hypothetical protein
MLYYLYYKRKYSRIDENAMLEASKNKDVSFLKWFKKSWYKFKYYNLANKTNFIKIIKFYRYYVNIKKLFKWSSNIFIKTIKFKTNHKYLKGYQKN